MPRWARWTRWTLLSQPRAWLAAALVLVPMACTNHLADDLVEVTAARRLQVVTADTAQVLLDQANVSLPSRVDSEPGAGLRHISFDIPLDRYMAAPLPVEPGQRRPPGRALLFSQAIEGMDVYLNGVWVAGLPRTNQAARYRWNRPLVVPLARRLLRTDGPNTVVVELSSYEARTLLPPMYVGSVASANLAFEMTAFIGSSMANASNLLCLLAGLFLLGAGWVSRGEGRAFAFAGALTTVWAVMFSLVLTPYMPVAWQPVREWLQYACLGGVAILLTLFVFAFIGERMPTVARRALFAAAMSVPLIYPVANLSMRGWIAQYWLPLLMLFYVYATGRLALHAVRTRRRPAFLLLALNILTQVFALHDHNVVAQLFALPVPGQGWSLAHLLASPVLLSHLTLPLLLLVMGQSLLEQMRSHVERIRQSNEVLSSTLAQRERELQVSYQRQRDMENEAAAQSERDRIYRELHDGIGSKLVTTLFSVREREITPPQLEQRLLDALKDLRETISETQPRETRPIQDILFGYASGMDEALSGDQFHVEIDIADGHEVVLLGDEARSLLRIVEETVANTVKHAGATRLRLSMAVDGRNVLRLCIDDNGRLGPQQPLGPDGVPRGLMAALQPAAHILSGGQGLAGMRRRAQQMGARYRFVRTRHGAHTRVHLPLGPRAPHWPRFTDPEGGADASVAQAPPTETRDDSYRSQSVLAESSTS
ncbi:hypothetical protein CDN98_01500 [Roseateles terrae]|nr:hypothetical protein CDN98_01500 [Roseateles terrae]